VNYYSTPRILFLIPEEPSEGEENVEDAEEMGEMTEEDDTEAEEEADVLKPGEDGEEEDEGETGGEEEGEGLELPPPEVEEVGEAEEEVQVIEEIPGEEVETFQEAVVQEAEVEEEEAEQEEEEEETEAEQEEEFTALRLSQGQGDFERASYEAEEGGEDEEFPNESPRQSLEKEEPLSEAAKEGTDAAEEPEVRESRPRIFVCGEAEKDRSLQVESYCCQQIKIPPLLPHVLKTYTKGAIKTQPRDLLRWSATYFRSLRILFVLVENRIHSFTLKTIASEGKVLIDAFLLSFPVPVAAELWQMMSRRRSRKDSNIQPWNPLVALQKDSSEFYTNK